ncbi:hypothetical protein [Actinoplanes awajinensis]|nr:hypothetical protein [Actinoplanes awajinensis]
MIVVLVCLTVAGAVVAALGTVYSMGWLILAGGFALIIGALAAPSAGSHR